MPLEPLDETQSIEEIDARIEEQLSVIVCIDAQMADRSAALHDGDLDRADFLDWSVRASERRGHAATSLVSLRHMRHRLTQAESGLRSEVSRLRAEVSRLRDTLTESGAECGTARQRKTIDELRRGLAEANRIIGSMRPDGDFRDTYKKHIHDAFLDGETAVLHTDCSRAFLARARQSVPSKYRDDYCERKTAKGMRRPRTSSECSAEEKGNVDE